MSCNFLMVITARWQLAVIVPPTTHHLSGRGSMAYGTKMTNSVYQTRYSRFPKPTPSPMNAVQQNEAEWGNKRFMRDAKGKETKGFAESEWWLHVARMIYADYTYPAHWRVPKCRPQPSASNCWRSSANSQGNRWPSWQWHSRRTKLQQSMWVWSPAARNADSQWVSCLSCCYITYQCVPFLFGLQHPDDCHHNLQHKVHHIHNDQWFLALSMRVGQVAALQRTLLKGIRQRGTQNSLDHVATLEGRVRFVSQRSLRARYAGYRLTRLNFVIWSRNN